MNDECVKVIEACVEGAHRGTLAFPEIVSRLAAVHVERYHADYTRRETTYYLAGGETHVAPLPLPDDSIAEEFSPSGVASAVAQSQRGEHTYQDFLRKTVAAGCVGYFVQIAGRRVLYFGRKGETHVELFPSAPTATATT